MSPRRRTVSDADLLAAARRLMGRLGPRRFTLAAVADAVGLAPATLLQRFGSKRGLLLALAGPELNAVPAPTKTRGARSRRTSPLERLRRFLGGFAKMAPSATELANHLAFLQIDLTDPEFHRITLEIARSNDREALGLVDEAVAARELQVDDPAGLARALLAVTGGSLLNWGIFREGSARDWILRDVDTVLRPYRSPAKGSRTGRRP